MMRAHGHSLLLMIAFGFTSLGYCYPVFAFTLQDAFIYAMNKDPAIRSSKYNQDASIENITIAKSRLLPQISLQGSSNQLTQTTIQDLPGNQILSRSFTGPSVNHQLVIRQGLMRPKEISAINFAELQSQFGEVKFQSDLSELWMRVAFAWVDLVGSAQLVEAYEKPLKPLLAAARQEKTRMMQGDGTKDAIVEAEAQYQLAVATYQQALQSMNAKQRAFEILTQLDSKLLLGLRLNLSPSPTIRENELDRLLHRAKDRSFELRFAELQVQLQRERLRMARADHLPTLDLIAAWNVAKNDATSTQGFRYQNNQVGVQYAMPIYAGGAISAAVRQAALALEASFADREAVTNRVEGDFRVLWATWLGHIARVRAGDKLIESSREQLKAAELSYVQGVKTVVELANAELMLSRRIADQVNVVIEYQKNMARLSRIDFDLDN
jgi:protease secretion system outer membrane protein